jgi:16S rRNA (cytidine1402-2'-O)-methyltransferase
MQTLDHKTTLKPALYLVATPIGNYLDITLHAIEILKNANFIACEDTRKTARLLSHLGIKQKLITYNDHSVEKERDNITNLILQGKSVAIVSDAGTPLIADPGYKLVLDCEKHNIKVIPAIGACSVIAALTIAGLPTDKFSFLGFLPNKKIARQKYYAEYKNINHSLVFFETARRLIASLEDLLSVMGDREIVIMREITKTYEEKIKGNISEILDNLRMRTEILGEIIILVSGVDETNELSQDQLHQLIADNFGKMSNRDLVELIMSCKPTISKQDIYKLILNYSK